MTSILIASIGKPRFSFSLLRKLWKFGAPMIATSLLSVVMHEIAHGLGFANFINEATGTSPLGLPDIYSKFSLDLTTG